SQLFATVAYGVEIGGETHAHVAGVAIGRAVKHGDACGIKQVMHEIQIIGDDLALGRTLAQEALDIGKHVERSSRLGAGHGFNAVKQVDDEIAAFFVNGDGV